MKAKTNLVIAGIVVFVLLATIIVTLSDGDEKTSGSDAKGLTLHLTPEEMKLLQIDADTPQDTVATLLGRLKQTDAELIATRKENESMQAQFAQLKADQVATVESTKEMLTDMLAEKGDTPTGVQDLSDNPAFQAITHQLEELKRLTHIGNNKEEIPPSIGLEGTVNPADLVWIEPLDKPVVGPNGGPAGAFPRTFGEGNNGFGEAGSGFDSASTSPTQSPEPTTVPVYTIPPNSTLTGSVAMIALLGRVPINGTVNDPYPFKVIIGKENLIANGIELPDVAQAVVSGTASGDWTLSCVRGQVHSMTFVFEDGRVRTLPESKGDQVGGSSRQPQAKQPIGWISDPYGLPCVAGEKKTNAREFLLTSFLLGAAQAGASAYALGETTQSVTSSGNGSSVATAITGDPGKYVAGTAIGGGVSDVRKWVQERFGQTFDAVYVPPGNKVAVHIDTPLFIDYELNGRKVNYGRDKHSFNALP